MQRTQPVDLNPTHKRISLFLEQNSDTGIILGTLGLRNVPLPGKLSVVDIRVAGGLETRPMKRGFQGPEVFSLATRTASWPRFSYVVVCISKIEMEPDHCSGYLKA